MNDAAPLDADTRGPVCDPRDPGCGPDEKCTTTRWRLDQPWPAPRCTPVAAEPSDPGNACFAQPGVFDLCDAEHACTNYGTGEGFCVPICSAPGTACAGSSDSACVTVDPSSGFALCLPRCETDDECGAPGLLRCVELDGFRVCDAARL